MFDWMSGTTVTVVACVVGILIILLVILSMWKGSAG